jgi:hypothetical protein
MKRFLNGFVSKLHQTMVDYVEKEDRPKDGTLESYGAMCASVVFYVLVVVSIALAAHYVLSALVPPCFRQPC